MTGFRNSATVSRMIVIASASNSCKFGGRYRDLKIPAPLNHIFDDGAPVTRDLPPKANEIEIEPLKSKLGNRALSEFWIATYIRMLSSMVVALARCAKMMSCGHSAFMVKMGRGHVAHEPALFDCPRSGRKEILEMRPVRRTTQPHQRNS